jgi:hypothetical protein
MIPAETRDKIKTHVLSKGVRDCDTWSGQEFEEFLRRDAESLLKRFIDGEPFPDGSSDLQAFAKEGSSISDEDSLALMARLFDRLAFYTPIRHESNLFDFRQAITDTIQAIGTGISKSRDGRVVANIVSRHRLKDESLRNKMQDVEKSLAKLRARFDDLTRSGVIRRCSCRNRSCSLYFMSPEAEWELDQLRREALQLFRDAYPKFVMPATW